MLDAKLGGRDIERVETGVGHAPTVPPRYSPYSIDWRFLPEPALLTKDFVRHHLVAAGNFAAQLRGTRAAWAISIGLRTSLTVTKAGIVFIHVPKTGGTSISSVLYGRNLPHYDASFYIRTFPSLMARLPSLAVIRDPLARFASGYRFIAQGGTDAMAADRYIRRALGHVADVEGLLDRLIARPDLRWQSGIFREQSSYVVSAAGQLQVDALFALSADGELPDGIGNWIDRARLPHINRSRFEPVRLSAAAMIKLRALYAGDFALYERLVANGGELTGRHTAIR